MLSDCQEVKHERLIYFDSCTVMHHVSSPKVSKLINCTAGLYLDSYGSEQLVLGYNESTLPLPLDFCLHQLLIPVHNTFNIIFWKNELLLTETHVYTCTLLLCSVHMICSLVRPKLMLISYPLAFVPWLLHSNVQNYNQGNNWAVLPRVPGWN